LKGGKPGLGVEMFPGTTKGCHFGGAICVSGASTHSFRGVGENPKRVYGFFERRARSGAGPSLEGIFIVILLRGTKLPSCSAEEAPPRGRVYEKSTARFCGVGGGPRSAEGNMLPSSVRSPPPPPGCASTHRPAGVGPLVLPGRAAVQNWLFAAGKQKTHGRAGTPTKNSLAGALFAEDTEGPGRPPPKAGVFRRRSVSRGFRKLGLRGPLSWGKRRREKIGLSLVGPGAGNGHGTKVAHKLLAAGGGARLSFAIANRAEGGGLEGGGMREGGGGGGAGVPRQNRFRCAMGRGGTGRGDRGIHSKAPFPRGVGRAPGSIRAKKKSPPQGARTTIWGDQVQGRGVTVAKNPSWTDSDHSCAGRGKTGQHPTYNFSVVVRNDPTIFWGDKNQVIPAGGDRASDVFCSFLARKSCGRGGWRRKRASNGLSSITNAGSGNWAPVPGILHHFCPAGEYKGENGTVGGKGGDHDQNKGKTRRRRGGGGGHPVVGPWLLWGRGGEVKKRKKQNHSLCRIPARERAKKKHWAGQKLFASAFGLGILGEAPHWRQTRKSTVGTEQCRFRFELVSSGFRTGRFGRRAPLGSFSEFCPKSFRKQQNLKRGGTIYIPRRPGGRSLGESLGCPKGAPPRGKTLRGHFPLFRVDQKARDRSPGEGPLAPELKKAGAPRKPWSGAPTRQPIGLFLGSGPRAGRSGARRGGGEKGRGRGGVLTAHERETPAARDGN